MIIVSGIRLPHGESRANAIDKAKGLLSLRQSDIENAVLHRASLDARHGSFFWVCSVSIALFDKEKEQKLADKHSFVTLREPASFSPKHGEELLTHRPVVVGFGPAGIFSALLLAQHGYRPIVIERGADVDARSEKVESFFTRGKLDEDSNVQFGEGGAGTFSDGKLTTRINDPLSELVLREFCEAGAPQSILYEAKPHIGTDILKSVVKNMRAKAVSLGAEIRFCEKLTDIKVKNGALKSLVTASGEIPCDAAIIAAGHSARELFGLVAERGASLESKAFSVGMRIEHLRSDVEQSLYGPHAGEAGLPAGEYALSTKVRGRAVYTFCMCPGGSVIAAASQRGGVVVNGMSKSARDAVNSNAALCVAVGPSDFGSDVFDGLRFQQRLERAAFEAAGSGYAAVGADVGSFLDGRAGLSITDVVPSYPLGVAAAQLDKIFGQTLCDDLRTGIRCFSGKLRCFGAKSAVLTGPETRTSSPIRIVRGETRECVGINGLYPAGEGAGYAGGIMSAAVDGLRTAAAIINKYKAE